MVFIQSIDVDGVVVVVRCCANDNKQSQARAKTQQFANKAVIMFYGITDRPWRVPAFIRYTENIRRAHLHPANT